MKREREEPRQEGPAPNFEFILLQSPIMSVMMRHMSDITVGRLLRVSHRVRYFTARILSFVRPYSSGKWQFSNIKFAASMNMRWIEKWIVNRQTFSGSLIAACASSDNFTVHNMIIREMQRVNAADKIDLYLRYAIDASSLPALMLADGQTTKTAIDHSVISKMLITRLKYDLLAKAVTHPLWSEYLDTLALSLLELVHNIAHSHTSPQFYDSHIKTWKLINVGVYIAKIRDLQIRSDILTGIETKCRDYGIPSDILLTEQNISCEYYANAPCTIPLDVMLRKLHFCKGTSSRCIPCYQESMQCEVDQLVQKFSNAPNNLIEQYQNIIRVRFPQFSPAEQLEIANKTYKKMNHVFLKPILDILVTNRIITVDNSIIIDTYLNFTRYGKYTVYHGDVINYLKHFHKLGIVFAGTDIADKYVCEALKFTYNFRISLRNDLIDLYNKGVITPTQKQYNCLIECMRKNKTTNKQYSLLVNCFGVMYNPADLQ
jgi:hypothetical protein